MLKLISIITVGYEKGEIDVMYLFESKQIIYLKLVGGWLKCILS